MMFPKHKPWRSKRYTDAARGQTCIRCGADDGTIVLAHYQGLGSSQLGKGRGMKPHDFCGADLCTRCHNEFDTYMDGNDADRAWEFLILCMQTIERRINDRHHQVRTRQC